MSHAARTHAKYPASGAAAFIACPGSIRRCEGLPSSRSAASDEGTATHELIEALLRCALSGNDGADVYHAQELLKVATPERKRSADECVNYVLELIDPPKGWTGAPATVLLEQRFTFPQRVVAPEYASGTCDIIIIIPWDRSVRIIDYKNGFETVEVMNNKQLKYYLVSAFEGLGDLIRAAGVTRAYMTIVQPNALHPAGPIRTQEVGFDELPEFIAEIESAILACEAPDAPLIPSKVACRWCDARWECPAREAESLRAIAPNFAGIRDVTSQGLPDPRQIGVERLLAISEAAPTIISWLKAIDEALLGLARVGGNVPGKKLVRSYSRREWNKRDPHGTAMELMGLLGPEADIDTVYPRKLITLTEAEALVKAAYKAKAPRGQKKEAAQHATRDLAFLTTKEQSDNFTLVGLEDPRDPVPAAAQAFGTITLTPQYVD